MKHTALCILAIGLLLLAGCQTAHTPRVFAEPNPHAGEELRRASEQWDDFFNSGEAANLALLYAEDAVSMPPNLPTLQGRKAIQSDFETFFAANAARHETMVTKTWIGNDLAIETAHYRLSFIPKAGGPEVVETGRHIECRRKIDGQWKIIAEIWNNDPAPK